MQKDPSFESPFNYANPPYDQVNVAMSIGQPWTMLTERPNLFNTAESPAESQFNAGAVGMGMGQDWAGMFQNPFQVGNPDQMNTEQSYNGGLADFKQSVIGVGMGQDWAMMDGNSNLFDPGAGDEAGFKTGFLGIGSHRIFCGRYCKSLGYLRSADKFGYVKCVKECQVNFKDIKSKRYKIKPSPEMDPNINIDPTNEESLANLTPTETATVTTPVESKTGVYVLIGVIVLVVVALIVFLIMRKRAAKA